MAKRKLPLPLQVKTKTSAGKTIEHKVKVPRTAKKPAKMVSVLGKDKQTIKKMKDKAKAAVPGRGRRKSGTSLDKRLKQIANKKPRTGSVEDHGRTRRRN